MSLLAELPIYPFLGLSLVAIGATAGWAWFYMRGGPRPAAWAPPAPVAAAGGPVALAHPPVAARALVAPVAEVRQPDTGEGSVPSVTFADVAGLDEAVEELSEIKEYLLDPDRFRALGATLPKGVLLVGPPGTGKTLLTRALAGEAGIPYQVVSAAGLVEVYVGVGPARVRQVFAQARKQAPSIVFIDELDAIGRSRAVNAAGGQEERESTLNQLLLEMDGFDATSGVLVVGATNRPDVLDPALLRPGRFDRRLVIAPPDLRGRQAILAIHAKTRPLGSFTDLDAVARRTAGFTGADLANVMNEAALLAGRRRKTHVGDAELDEAVDRVLSGPQRPSSVLTDADRRVVAYHEAGHVLVARAVASGHEVHRVSIVARGLSYGSTLSVPTSERVLISRNELVAQLAVLMGGRAAEELVFSDPTTGAQDDLARATAIARRMVAELGMSDEVGPLSVDLGGLSGGELGGIAQLGAGKIGGDMAAEIRRLLHEARATAADVVAEHRTSLDRLAGRLIRCETLEKPEIDHLLAGVAPRHQPAAA